MLRQVAFKSDNKRKSYPLCAGAQECSRTDGVMQPRQDYCSTCLTNPVCKENGCCNHVPSGGKNPRKKAQWSPHGQCADHVRTSTSGFDWTVNSSIGCTQLSMQDFTWGGRFAGVFPISNFAAEGMFRN